MVHVEYLYEVRLPAVVLGEADHAQDALVPGGVSGPVVRQIELHHRHAQALVLPVTVQQALP